MFTFRFHFMPYRGREHVRLWVTYFISDFSLPKEGANFWLSKFLGWDKGLFLTRQNFICSSDDGYLFFEEGNS